MKPDFFIYNIIARNPYRILGIYGNSSKREQLANVSRISAFLRVKQSISFPLDKIAHLPLPVRTEQSVSQANAALSLPIHRLRYALFWLMKISSDDERALKALESGDTEQAMIIWQTSDTVSAQHNLALCCFFMGYTKKAFRLLEELYAVHASELGKLIDDSLNTSESQLVDLFLSSLKEESPDALQILDSLVSRPVWIERITRSLSDKLLQLIKDCYVQDESTPEKNLENVENLVRVSAPILHSIKLFMGVDDPIYRSLSDQVAEKALRGIVRYYNRSESEKDLLVVLRVMKQVRDIACGSEIIERCTKNINFVQKEIDEYPSDETGKEGEEIYQTIKNELTKNTTISSIHDILRSVKRKLKVVKKRLGAENAAYLQLSSWIATYVHKHLMIVLIERLNKEKVRKEMRETLEDAWAVFRQLDFFAMDPTFREKEYAKDRMSVKKLCMSLSVKTFYFADTIHRYPKFFTGIITILIIVPFACLTVAEVQAEELKSLVSGAKTKEDWKSVIAIARTKTMATNQMEIIKSAESALKEFELYERLKSRFNVAETASEFESIAANARRTYSTVASLKELGDKAKDRAEELRIKEEAEKYERLWGTESKAWNTVKNENSKAACLQYLKLYPMGKHAEDVKKRQIDIEVANIFESRDYGELPAPQRTSFSYSSTASITVTNDTQYVLTILYSGETSEKLEIPAHETRSLKLPTSTYRVVASVDASGVRPFAGTETYRGGSYQVTYYISSTPSPSYRYSTFSDLNNI
ncbi:hypothetical protein [Akkermansia muciniphila]|uniref:Uncharacterized protein n=1 Tax=Akkermansia muciniphila TaxID=239935 RepID=A0AAP8NKV2_9BACT|nr:hypothetical protein [Akkermansia muciniphila]PNC55970.1 hypothetical protein CXU09_07765 [Akkermansia muciniphila]